MSCSVQSATKLSATKKKALANIFVSESAAPQEERARESTGAIKGQTLNVIPVVHYSNCAEGRATDTAALTAAPLPAALPWSLAAHGTRGTRE